MSPFIMLMISLSRKEFIVDQIVDMVRVLDVKEGDGGVIQSSLWDCKVQSKDKNV